ncbi:MAG: hypothetical protein E7511_08755 [Ruminococcus sp.]|nr:hypothetical protein [Ruminococcus sp.]
MQWILQIFVELTAFCLLAIWASNLFNIVFSLIFAPMFSLKLNQISFFGLTLQLHQKKWRTHFQKPSLLIQSNVVVDLSKEIPESIEQQDRNFNILRTGTMLILSILLVLWHKDVVTDFLLLKEMGIWETFCASFALGVLFHSLVTVGIMIYTYAVIMRRLGGYVQSLINRIRQGATFESLQVQPLSALPYKNPSRTEVMMYYNFLLPYLLTTGQPEAMRAPIQDMTTYFWHRQFIMQETMNYYWLIFYYSRFEVNPHTASYFYEKIRSVIENDPDANSKRIQAYYYYAIVMDPVKARQCIAEGLAVVDQFSLPGCERELERQLLNELSEIMDKQGLALTK